jgi:hypothetical protein
MPKTKYNIVLLICWKGTWPWYFRFFVHSVKYNPTIDFIIFTDELIEIELPKNIKIIKYNLDSIGLIASKKLGFIVSLPNAYKLCDFKPTYGYIFNEHIKGYDFWGHCDIDLIFGDIRKFMNNKLLSEYEVISSRHDYVAGTFTLFKNNEKINSLFKFSKDYKMVLANEEHYCFDECNFLFKPLEQGYSILELPSAIESMTHVVMKLKSERKIKAFFDFMIFEGNMGNLIWNHGKVIYKRTYEGLYYNLIRFKKNIKNEPTFESIPDTFYITNNEILTTKPISNL